MAKMFAKIAKTFVGLLATVVAKGRRLVLILHLEAKYVKMDCKNEIYAKKLDKEHLDCKKSTLEKSQRLTQASDVSDDAIGLTWQNNVSKRVEAREGV